MHGSEEEVVKGIVHSFLFSFICRLVHKQLICCVITHTDISAFAHLCVLLYKVVIFNSIIEFYTSGNQHNLS